MNYDNKEFERAMNSSEFGISSLSVPALMRKVYTWMTLALLITGFTSYGVATSPGILQMIFGNQIVFWGLIIAEFALVFTISGAINRLGLGLPLFSSWSTLS